MENIEAFNHCAALIFGELYRRFPIPTRLDIDQLGPDVFADIEANDAEAEMVRISLYCHTVKWLKNAGYLWASDIREAQAFNVVLSPLGLEALKAPLTFDCQAHDKTPIGDRLQTAIKEKTWSLAKICLNEALATGVELAIRRVMGG